MTIKAVPAYPFRGAPFFLFFVHIPLGLLVGRGQMWILGRVFKWGSVCVGSNGFRGQRVGLHLRVGAGWVGRNRLTARCRFLLPQEGKATPSPPHLPSSDVHGSRYSSSTSHLLRITPSSSSTTHSLPSSSCKMPRSVGERTR